jgi:hypothetical protein
MAAQGHFTQMRRRLEDRGEHRQAAGTIAGAAQPVIRGPSNAVVIGMMIVGAVFLYLITEGLLWLEGYFS